MKKKRGPFEQFLQDTFDGEHHCESVVCLSVQKVGVCQDLQDVVVHSFPR